MSLTGKQLVLGSAALILLSFGVAFLVLELTDEGTAHPILRCNAWNSGAEAAARARALELQTSGADAAVFLRRDISAEDRQDLEEFIKARPEANSVAFENRQDAYRKFSELFADEGEIVRSTSPDALPESFRVTLDQPERFDEFKLAVEARRGIDQVRDDRNTLASLLHWSGPLKTIKEQGYYLDRGGKRVDLPAVCTS